MQRSWRSLRSCFDCFMFTLYTLCLCLTCGPELINGAIRTARVKLRATEL